MLSSSISSSSLFVVVDVEAYSLVLLVCDLVLSAAWHVCTKHVVVAEQERSQIRLRHLSPSVRFTFGVLFGLARLWAIAHLQPTPLYFFLARLCFLGYLVLGLAALVFNDGPWRNVRPNDLATLNRDSILNPYATINKALSLTKLQLVKPALRSALVSGDVVSIVLDVNGSLLYAKRGSLEVKQLESMMITNSSLQRCLFELYARKVDKKSRKLWSRSPFAVSTSGDDDSDFVFGFLPDAPFSRGLNQLHRLSKKQKASLVELFTSLNRLHTPTSNPHGDLSSMLAPWPPCAYRLIHFRIPKQIALRIKTEISEEEMLEAEMDSVWTYSKQPSRSMLM